jgi:hypothetical protein
MTNINDETIKKRADQFLEKVIDRMFYLRWRWDDECKYEDFDDYITAARKETVKAGDGFEFVSWSRDGHLEVSVESLFVHFLFLAGGTVLQCITSSRPESEQWKKLHHDLLVELHKNKKPGSGGVKGTYDEDPREDPCMPETNDDPKYRENMAETSGDELTKLDYMEMYNMEDDR